MPRLGHVLLCGYSCIKRAVFGRQLRALRPRRNRCRPLRRRRQMVGRGRRTIRPRAHAGAGRNRSGAIDPLPGFQNRQSRHDGRSRSHTAALFYRQSPHFSGRQPVVGKRGPGASRATLAPQWKTGLHVYTHGTANVIRRSFECASSAGG